MPTSDNVKLSDKTRMTFSLENLHFLRREMFAKRGSGVDELLALNIIANFSGTMLEDLMFEFIDHQCDSELSLDSCLKFLSAVIYRTEIVLNKDVMQERIFDSEQE